MNISTPNSPNPSDKPSSHSVRRAETAARRLNQEAEYAIRPHAVTIVRIFDDAWDEWNMIVAVSSRSADFSPSARASLMNNMVTKEIERVFAGVPGVHIVKDRSFITLVLGELAVLRVKKINANRLACVNKTRRSDLYFRHMLAQLTIPGLEEFVTTPSLIPAVLGYQLDPLQSEVADVAMTCQFRDQVIFDLSLIDLIGGRPQDGQPTAPITPEPPLSRVPVIRPIVRLTPKIGSEAEEVKKKK